MKARTRWRGSLNAVRQDVRHAWRGWLRRAPALALTVLATLALRIGIAVAMAVFGVAHGVLLRPVPYPEPGWLVVLHSAYPTLGTSRGNRS